MIGKTAAAAALLVSAFGVGAIPAYAAETSSNPGAAVAPLADRPCGGPYKVGDDAVWYNCNNKESEQICVRQYAPYFNYNARVKPGGEHHNSWRWTIDMSEGTSHC